MKNKSLLSKIVFFTGVFLIGALLVSNAKHWLSQKTQKSRDIASSVQSATSSIKPAVSEKKEIAAAPQALEPEEQKKWTTLREILRSKNDNDPRLDKELRNLSLKFHSELEKQYQALPMESRNERGLIAFIIARDLKDPQDLDFLKSLYQENPCLSLEDCSSPSHSDPHLSGVDQTSANYPQLAALYQLERQMDSGNILFQDNNYKDQMRQLLANAAQFPVPMVQKKAESIRSSHPF